MAISKKLEIMYHNGQPDGIRSIRRHLSTMTTYVIPRPLLSEAKKLSGINRPGIYYLISENDDNKIAQIYVGQTRNGVTRLDDHNRCKDFWNKAIMFLADNKTFSLDMISGLEAYAIGKAHDAKRYKVENAINPKYEIDEYDLPLIEEVYEEIQFIMPISMELIRKWFTHTHSDTDTPRTFLKNLMILRCSPTLWDTRALRQRVFTCVEPQVNSKQSLIRS